jgi:hypothetical protein
MLNKQKLNTAKDAPKKVVLTPEQKLTDLRTQEAMKNIERAIVEHRKDATKTVRILRVDLLNAWRMLVNASCQGQFSAWLRAIQFPRATAYYILGKKDTKGTDSNGKKIMEFSPEGTGKWNEADPKPLSAKAKAKRAAARKQDAKKNFEDKLVELLVSKKEDKAREFLGRMFYKAFEHKLGAGKVKFREVDHMKATEDFLRKAPQSQVNKVVKNLPITRQGILAHSFPQPAAN